MPYAIVALIFLLPFLLFLKTGGVFKAFSYAGFVRALNLSCIVYLLLSIGFAFLYAWLEADPDINIDAKGTNEYLLAKVSLLYNTIALAGILPLFIILNIIKWIVVKKPTPPTEENDK
jgi:uncharacterized protein (DUF486 family)